MHGTTGPCLFGPLGPVFRTTLPAITNTLGVEHAAHNVIAHARKVLDTPATNENNRMLLKIMPLTRYITCHLEAIGQTHTRNLAQGGVRLFGRRRINPRANTSLLRTSLHSRNLVASHRPLSGLANQLLYCGHLPLSNLQYFHIPIQPQDNRRRQRHPSI